MAILERLKEMQDAHGKNRVVMVLDGMGVAVMEKLLDRDGFFRSNLKGSEESIIPASTVAATTAYRTGKMPYETGFIGWTQYFREVDEIVEMFTNKNACTYEVSKLPIHSNTLPCKTVVEELNENGRRAFEITPWFMGGYKTFDEWLNRVVLVCNQETDAYIYAYWGEPDSLLHKLGSKDIAVKNLLCEMEQKIAKAFQQIHNKTELLITADHGHKGIKSLFLEDFPDIKECQVHPLSLESRCVAFFVKPEYIDKFPEVFNYRLAQYFKLVTKAEFERKYLHAPKPVRFIGDFVAMATDKYELLRDHSCHHGKVLKSEHGGITRAERIVPIIRMNNDQKVRD